MQVRAALVADEAALESLADEPLDAARLVRDRDVRIAERDGEPVGFVAFDAWRDVVHVTRLVGDHEAAERLLEEPLGFAKHEGLPAEIVLLESDDEIRDVIEAAAFGDVGPGPRFEDEPTRRYRKDVT